MNRRLIVMVGINADGGIFRMFAGTPPVEI